MGDILEWEEDILFGGRAPSSPMDMPGSSRDRLNASKLLECSMPAWYAIMCSKLTFGSKWPAARAGDRRLVRSVASQEGAIFCPQRPEARGEWRGDGDGPRRGRDDRAPHYSG